LPAGALLCCVARRASLPVSPPVPVWGFGSWWTGGWVWGLAGAWRGRLGDGGGRGAKCDALPLLLLLALPRTAHRHHHPSPHMRTLAAVPLPPSGFGSSRLDSSACWSARAGLPPVHPPPPRALFYGTILASLSSSSIHHGPWRGAVPVNTLLASCEL